MTIAEKIEELRTALEEQCADFETAEGVIVVGDITVDGVTIQILTQAEAEAE